MTSTVQAVKVGGITPTPKAGPDMVAEDTRGVIWARMPKGRWEADACDVCGCDVGPAGAAWVSRRGEVRCDAHGVRCIVARVDALPITVVTN